jgi:NAD-dependent deacetylase
LSHTFFVTHTEEFFEFYRNKILYKGAQPNKAHLKLAELENAGKLTAVITQNIDGLHQMAGSKNVLELHGSVHRNYCQKCHAFYDMEFIRTGDGVPRCQCGGLVKPDVVLYEESLDNTVMDAAVKAISEADMMIVGGTSLAVYPAAGLFGILKEMRWC